MTGNLENMRCVALAGGVGGARMADGLYRALEPHALTVIVNTGDDFEHFGLTVCPDLDTVMYTLSGLVNPETGWGVANDSRHAMAQLAVYGEEPWFIIGDRDLATHVRRTHLLREGMTLTDATQALCTALGLKTQLLPMADRPVATFVITQAGERLPFQDYFVRRRHQDPVARVEFAHAQYARVSDAAREHLAAAELIVFCPSNPFLSVAPILEVPMMREHILDSAALRIGVSPIVGGAAIKGPAADMMTAMGHECSALGIARLYRELIDVLYIDEQDATLAPAIREIGIDAVVAPTVMRTDDDRRVLASHILSTARQRLAVR